MKNAIVLCSGGLDSVTTVNYAKKKLNYDNIKVIFFNYNQRNLKQEKFAAKKCANYLELDFVEISIPWIGKISKSLLNKKVKIKSVKTKDLKNTLKESKKWYVPCRNIIFLTYALALAESLLIKEKKVYDIFVGFKCEGKESFPDSTPEFLKLFNNLSRTSTIGKFLIKAPLINKDKEDIVLLAKNLGVNLEKSYSCYVGKKKHCGICLACRLRHAGFYWANIKDPTEYISKRKENI